ncbi:MAG TPA: hypothetical protein VK639_12590, partial [Terriglobales bacterium]|nr:hypothetical protein [Terriglobales bacterium]
MPEAPKKKSQTMKIGHATVCGRPESHVEPDVSASVAFRGVKTRKGISRSVRLILFCAALSRIAQFPGATASDEGNVPGPSRAFTPRTVLAFYADLQGASRSAIWKALGDKTGPLMEQLQSMQQGQLSSLHSAQVLPAFQQTNMAEMTVILEGDKVLNSLQSGQLDPGSGFLAVIRLTQSQDVDHLIQEALEAIEKVKPGLRGQIEKSRRRVGAAQFFDLPAEALGDEKPPFQVSCAVGPGKDGTVVALGRSENLRAFLSGQTEGTLRGQVNETLSRRGQIWFYVSVPKDATNSLGAGPAGLNANPMLAGLAQSMDKVREVNFSFNFAASQVDFQLDLACVDGAAANQLAQGAQGILGMVQLSAKQNPASMPPFVGKIKAAAEGAAFRLTTAITMRDFDLALQNVKRGVAAARPRVSSPSPKPEAAATPQPVQPVEVEFVQFNSDEQQSLRPAKMRVQNRSSRPVKELKLTFTYLDQSGRKLGQWTRNHTSLTSENLLGGETT